MTIRISVLAQDSKKKIMPDISDKVVIYLLLNVNCVTWNLEMVEKIKMS